MKFAKKAAIATVAAASLSAGVAAPASAETTGLGQLNQAVDYLNTATATLGKIGTLNNEIDKLVAGSQTIQKDPAGFGATVLGLGVLGVVIAYLIGLIG